MKKCTRCQIEKPTEEFRKNRSRKDGLQSACGECHNKYTQRHYKNNKAYYVTKAARNTEKYKQVVRDLKEASPCKDCGKYYSYYVMDFDHLKDKKCNVSKLIADGKVRAAFKEIEKCELVCSNCHRERTHKRFVSEMDITQVYET